MALSRAHETPTAARDTTQRALLPLREAVQRSLSDPYRLAFENVGITKKSDIDDFMKLKDLVDELNEIESTHKQTLKLMSSSNSVPPIFQPEEEKILPYFKSQFFTEIIKGWQTYNNELPPNTQRTDFGTWVRDFRNEKFIDIAQSGNEIDKSINTLVDSDPKKLQQEINIAFVLFNRIKSQAKIALQRIQREEAVRDIQVGNEHFAVKGAKEGLRQLHGSIRDIVNANPYIAGGAFLVGIGLSLLEKHRDKGLALIFGSAAAVFAASVEVPEKDESVSEQYLDVFGLYVPRVSKREKTISRLEAMVSGQVGNLSFGEIFDQYETAKQNGNYDEIKRQRANEKKPLRSKDIPPLGLSKFISGEDQETSFEAMDTLYTMLSANHLIDDFKAQTFKDRDGKEINGWDAFKKMDFNIVGQIVQTFTKKGNLTGFVEHVGSIFKQNSIEVVDSVIRNGTLFMQQYAGRCAAIRRLYKKDMPDIEMNPYEHMVTAYGVPFRMEGWVESPGNQEAKVFDAPNSVGARFYYLPNRNAAWARFELFHDKRFQEESPEPHELEGYAKIIVEKKLANKNIRNYKNLEWDPKLQKWTMDITIPAFMSVPATERTVALNISGHFGKVESNDFDNMYHMRVHDVKIENGEKVFDSKPYEDDNEIIANYRRDKITKPIAEKLAVPQSSINIEDRDLLKASEDGTGLPITVLYDNQEIKMTVSYDGANWSSELADKSIENQSAYLRFIFKELGDEIYQVQGKLKGIPIPGFIEKQLGSFFATDKHEWSEISKAALLYALTQLKTMDEDTRTKYVEELISKVRELKENLSEYKEGGAKEGDKPAEATVKDWLTELSGVLGTFEGPEYADSINGLRESLRDQDFENETRLEIVFSRYNNALKTQLEGVTDSEEKKAYVDYLTRMYDDLGLVIGNDEIYSKKKDLFTPGGKAIQTFEDFNKNQPFEGKNYTGKQVKELIDLEQEVFEKKKLNSLWKPARNLIRAMAIRVRQDTLDQLKAGFTIDKDAYRKKIEGLNVAYLQGLLNNSSDVAQLPINFDLWSWKDEYSISSYLQGAFRWTGSALGKLVRGVFVAIGGIWTGATTDDAKGYLESAVKQGEKWAKETDKKGDEDEEDEDDREERLEKEAKKEHDKLRAPAVREATEAEKAAGEGVASALEEFQPLDQNDLNFSRKIPFNKINLNDPRVATEHQAVINAGLFTGDIVFFSSDDKLETPYIYLTALTKDQILIQNFNGETFKVPLGDKFKNKNQEQIKNRALLRPGDVMTILDPRNNNNQAIDVICTANTSNESEWEIKYKYKEGGEGEIFDKENLLGYRTSNSWRLLKIHTHGPEQLLRTKREIKQSFSNDTAEMIIGDFNYEIKTSSNENNNFDINMTREREYDCLDIYILDDPSAINGVKLENIGEIQIDKAHPDKVRFKFNKYSDTLTEFSKWITTQKLNEALTENLPKISQTARIEKLLQNESYSKIDTPETAANIIINKLKTLTKNRWIAILYQKKYCIEILKEDASGTSNPKKQFKVYIRTIENAANGKEQYLNPNPDELIQYPFAQLNISSVPELKEIFDVKNK